MCEVRVLMDSGKQDVIPDAVKWKETDHFLEIRTENMAFLYPIERIMYVEARNDERESD